MKKVILLVTLLAILNVSAFGADPNDTHVIKSIKYYPMLDGYCAMTALRMNLNYYDVDVEQSFLLNLGWNYGFFLVSNPFYVGAYACTDPPQEIIYVSELLGFEAMSITHASLDEAKVSLVKYISQDTPVLVQLTPHTILAYGYEDEGNTIIVYNPADPKPQLMPKTQWTQSKFNIAEWLKEPLYWQYRGYQIVIVKPKTKESKIEWKNIWKRAAKKTLGVEAGDHLNYSGIKGLQSFAQGIKNHFGQNEPRFRQTLHNFRRTFALGVGFRRNASSFLSGQATILNNPNLSNAAKCFRTSALLFRKGENLLNWSKHHPEDQPKVETEIIIIIQQLIKSEQSAASFLFKAAK